MKNKFFEWLRNMWNLIRGKQQCKWPTSFQTVDIAVIKNGTQVLLGTKPNCPDLRFPGGFVDPELDQCLEFAAAREMREECGRFAHTSMRYAMSTRIDDPRYRGSKDGIMTALFETTYTYGDPVASDDLETLTWVDIKDLPLFMRSGKLSTTHAPLFAHIISKYS